MSETFKLLADFILRKSRLLLSHFLRMEHLVENKKKNGIYLKQDKLMLLHHVQG